MTEDEIQDDENTYFIMTQRSCIKRLSPTEVAFLKANALVKFAPYGEAPFVVPQQPLEPFPPA